MVTGCLQPHPDDRRQRCWHLRIRPARSHSSQTVRSDPSVRVSQPPDTGRTLQAGRLCICALSVQL